MSVKSIKPSIFYPVFVIMGLYILSLFIFILLRIFNFIYNHPHHKESFFKIIDSFINGLRFDLVPLTYGFAVVFVFLLIYLFTSKIRFRELAFFIATIWLILLTALYLTDVVYYNKFGTHLNAQVYFWLKDFSTVLKMIFTSPQLIFVLLPVILLSWFIYLVIKKIFNLSAHKKNYSPFLKYFIYPIVFVIMFFLGKGKIISHALSVEMAFNDDNFFMNDFKINPYFTLKRSIGKIEEPVSLTFMAEDEAIAYIRKQFGIDTLKYTSPIARDYEFAPEINDSLPNIVYIFLERKASWKMAYFGNQDTLTPFLDSLFLQSIAFDQFYSSGTRTFEGIFGGLYGYPILFGEHPLYGDKGDDRQKLKFENIDVYYGLPQVLEEKGYASIYFCPHTARFDNMGVFLPYNGFSYFYSEKSFPDSLQVNAWGVDDWHLFQFTLHKLDDFYKKNRKFFAVVQTITDHEPYYYPDTISGKTPAIRAARYADAALKYFFDQARKKPWFENTVFILVGDHGKPHNPKYPIDLGTHHVPFLIFNKNITPRIIHTIGDQKDIMPTVLAFLKMNYIDNTFGKNLFSHPYEYAYFNHYQLNGLITPQYFLILNDQGKIKGLYDYKHHRIKNLKDSLPEVVNRLSTHLKAHLQASYYIRKHHLQGKPIPLRKIPNFVK